MRKLPHYRLKYYRSVWKRWKPILVTFVILIITCLAINIFFFDFSRADYRNWYVSFTCSLVFFGIGVVSALLGSKLPQEESFNTRTSVLTNGKYATKEAEKFLRQQIERLMTYNKINLLTLTILKLDTNKKFIYVHVDIDVTVVNMCEDENIPLTINGSVETDHIIDGNYGFVNQHYVRLEGDNYNNTDKFKIHHFIPDGHTRNLNDLNNHKYIIENQRVDIDSNGKAFVKMCYEIWLPLYGNKSDSNDWFYNTFTNYTEHFNFTIVNTLADLKLSYELKYQDRSLNVDSLSEITDIGIVNANERKVVTSDLKFQNNDKFEVFFTQQEI